MDNNFTILPKIFDKELIAKYYSLADVFVICSLRENFPTTCIEAQCCGTKVVGFDTGGTKETSVSDADDFVKYGDIEGLKLKVLEALNKRCDDISSKAISQYSKENMAQKYLDIYDEKGKKNRILLIDVNCKKSSTGKIVYDLYNYIKEHDREAAICYGRGEKISEDNIYKFGIDAETNIHAGLARITGYNGYFSPISTRRLIKYIEKYKPDVIHIHELHAYFVNIKELMTYIKNKKIPVVWTFHCEYMYTGKCGHAYECIKFQTECKDCKTIRDYPKSLFFDRTNQMFKMKKEVFCGLNVSIVTPSKWLAERVKLSFLKDHTVSVIHNGIDTMVFHPVDATDLRKELKIPTDYKIVLALAPDIMSEKKGGEWVLELAKEMRNKKIHFILIGK